MALSLLCHSCHSGHVASSVLHSQILNACLSEFSFHITDLWCVPRGVSLLWALSALGTTSRAAAVFCLLGGLRCACLPVPASLWPGLCGPDCVSGLQQLCWEAGSGWGRSLTGKRAKMPGSHITDAGSHVSGMWSQRTGRLRQGGPAG